MRYKIPPILIFAFFSVLCTAAVAGKVDGVSSQTSPQDPVSGIEAREVRLLSILERNNAYYANLAQVC